MPICTKCKEGSGYTIKDGTCEKDRAVSAQDINCAEYGFDSNGLQICRMCESGYEILNGRCEKEGTTLFLMYYNIIPGTHCNNQ